MKKIKLTMLAIAIVFFCSYEVVVAENTQENQHHFYEMGVELSGITYKEPGLMKQVGEMIGIAGSYTYHNDVMFELEGIFKYGRVDYEGRLSNGTLLILNNVDDYIMEIRGLSGYDFQIFTRTRITPYVGFGYRYLVDNMGAVSIYGYDRESNYMYSPLGLTTLTHLRDGWSVGITLEYDIFWKGVQKSHFGDLQYGYNTIKKDQESGFGLRGSLKLQKSHFLIEPFIRYWNIEDSNVSMLTFHQQPTGRWYIEPKNNSMEIGLKIAWKF